MPILSWLPEGLKDELGWSVEDAAQEELNQDTRRGYDPTRGTAGAGKRGFWESVRDSALGNSEKDIQERARQLYVERLQQNNPEYRDLNSQLETLGEKERVNIKSNTKQGDLTQQITRIERALPYLQGIDSKDGDRSGVDTKSSVGQLKSTFDDANRDKGRSDYLTSPEYLDMKNQQNLTNQMALSQMSLSEQRASNQMQIAMMDNQLDRRRLDMQEKRIDRRDRQAYIQQLMAGLSTLGASIAI